MDNFLICTMEMLNIVTTLLVNTSRLVPIGYSNHDHPSVPWNLELYASLFLLEIKHVCGWEISRKESRDI